ncbi:MAG: cadherin repeat domain-containing protein, partial [Mesorhizobium sp.]
APTGITASASDPDAGSTVTYSINDTRFAINSSTGVITRSGTGTLDFETQSSINLTVTATSSDGSTANKSFTLAVLDSP